MKVITRRGLVTAAFAVLFVIWAVDFWVEQHTFYRLQQTQRQISRLKDTRIELLKLVNAYADAETGQRGYLLTGDERYLEPYQSARSRLDASTTRLQKTLSENPELKALLEHGQAKLNELQQTIDLRRRGEPEEALA